MVDTNVLIYAYYEDVPQYPAAFPLLDRAQEADAGLWLALRCSLNFMRLLPIPVASAPPLPVKRLWTKSRSFKLSLGLTLLPVPLDVVDRWVSLLR